MSGAVIPVCDIAPTRLSRAVLIPDPNRTDLHLDGFGNIGRDQHLVLFEHMARNGGIKACASYGNRFFAEDPTVTNDQDIRAYSTDIHNDSRSVSLMVRWTFNTINNPFKCRSGNDATLHRTQETVN